MTRPFFVHWREVSCAAWNPSFVACSHFMVCIRARFSQAWPFHKSDWAKRPYFPFMFNGTLFCLCSSMNVRCLEARISNFCNHVIEHKPRVQTSQGAHSSHEPRCLATCVEEAHAIPCDDVCARSSLYEVRLWNNDTVFCLISYNIIKSEWCGVLFSVIFRITGRTFKVGQLQVWPQCFFSERDGTLPLRRNIVSQTCSNEWMWSSALNAVKILRKRTRCYEKFMVMNVYLGLGFLSCLKGLKREGKTSRTICFPVVPGRQKQMTTMRKAANSSEGIDAWALLLLKDGEALG